MQGGARGGHAPAYQAPPDDTPATNGPDPPNLQGPHITPRSGQLTRFLRLTSYDFAAVFTLPQAQSCRKL